jgi:hypothetical protein
MTYIITIQHIQRVLFCIKFGVAPEDGRRPPNHIGEETVLLHAYIKSNFWYYKKKNNDISGSCCGVVETFALLECYAV